MKSEKSWILIGTIEYPMWHGRKYKETLGEPSSVNFNHKFVIRREEKRGDICGFLHTHPHCSATPSERDHRTMRAWVTCLGKPLICAILGVDGLKAYCYIDDEEDHYPYQCESAKLLGGNFIAGVVLASPLQMAKREDQKLINKQLHEHKKIVDEMRAKELVPGRQYIDAHTDKIVEFSRIGQTGFAIVHPPGEPDMQSSYGMKPSELLDIEIQGG